MLKDFKFTTDYVTSRVAGWAVDLAHLAGKPDVRGLEIGVFEGRSLQWWMQNILTDSSSTLVAIDPFAAKFADNLEKLKADPSNYSRVNFRPETGQMGMAKMIARGESGTIDFCYIDGGKEPHNILQTSTMAWLLCKPGAIIIWDDYEWAHREDMGHAVDSDDPPKVGIDAFLMAHKGKYEEVRRGWQITIRKK
jgi:predicted O-methyltransferase YrrM